MTKEDFDQIIGDIQSKFNAPKKQFNKFGNYSYRSCEDILSELKNYIGGDSGLRLTIDDNIIMVGSRIYVEATVGLHKGEFTHSAKSMARESETKKGMDDSQITGTASSYARKYALNGLLCIDDTKDADSNERRVESNNKNISAPSISSAPALVLGFFDNQINPPNEAQGKLLISLLKSYKEEYGSTIISEHMTKKIKSSDKMKVSKLIDSLKNKQYDDFNTALEK